IDRQHTVLGRMLVDGKITREQYEDALAFDIRSSLAQPKEKAYTTYPYLMIEAEQRAAKILLKLQNPKLTDADLRSNAYTEQINEVSEMMRTNGYKIYTTIDQEIYDAMQEIAHNPDNFTPDIEGKGMEQIGAVLIDNKTGAILGMIEGRDFYKEQLNHATQMERQPGSTMKPIAAYGPAIEMGAIQPATPLDDSPVVQPDGSKGFHIPVNWDGKYHGLISARTALNWSYNIPAIKLFNQVVGIDQAWEYAKKMGITTLTEEDYHARTGVIGGLKYGVTIEELTGAYSTFPNKGVFLDPFMIRKIVDGEGNVVYEHNPKPVQVFSPETAFLITDMLRTVITEGTATDIRRKFKYYDKVPTVGKTGSTQFDFDAWFEGYTPDLTLGVWAGYDQPSTLTYGQGTSRAKNIWSLVMNKVYELKPELFATKEFAKPDDVIKMTVSDITGKLPNELERKTNHLITDWFAKRSIPTQTADMLIESDVIPFNHVNYLPNPATPRDMIQHKVLFKRQVPTKTVIDQIKEAFAKYPQSIPEVREGVKKKPEDYIPLDASQEAPVEMDPRVDDGEAPPAVTDIKIEKKSGLAIITFQPDSQEDVIGYRLYRSMNNAPFKRQGAPVYTGDAPKFVDYITAANSYAYYITAVDVAGNESAPSGLVFTDDNAAGQIFMPPVTGDNNGSQDDKPNAGAPASPRNLVASPRDGGIGVQLTWDANADNDSVIEYRIFYSSQQNGEYTLIGSTESTRFEYISLPADGWYKITAVNVNGESPFSAPVHFVFGP
ncbi:MAG TPA: penicillin-binding transpeptidase domain-containing protein, partial [Bacilli bacterium]